MPNLWTWWREQPGTNRRVGKDGWPRNHYNARRTLNPAATQSGGTSPRRAVVDWICQLLLLNDFDARKASVAAYNMRTADNGNNDNPIWREGENWLTAAAWDRWYDPQAYVMNIYLWQYFKYLPGTKEPFFQDALNAGLDGHRHAKASKKDLKKWCQDCDR